MNLFIEALEGDTFLLYLGAGIILSCIGFIVYAVKGICTISKLIKEK